MNSQRACALEMACFGYRFAEMGGADGGENGGGGPTDQGVAARFGVLARNAPLRLLAGLSQPQARRVPRL